MSRVFALAALLVAPAFGSDTKLPSTRKRLMTLQRYYVLAVALACVVLQAGRARAVSLADLLAGQSLETMGFVFSDWALEENSGTTVVDPSLIQVRTDPDFVIVVFDAEASKALLVEAGETIVLRVSYQVSAPLPISGATLWCCAGGTSGFGFAQIRLDVVIETDAGPVELDNAGQHNLVFSPRSPSHVDTRIALTSSANPWSHAHLSRFYTNLTPVGECGDALDNDSDGLTDLADPGCADTWDLDEHALALTCDDGVDNDGDGWADYLAAGGGDPACASPTSLRENPQCQDGINNDYSPGIDFDGGASLNGGVPISTPDRQCVGMPWRNSEAVGAGCGLGFELVFLAPLLARLTRRRAEPRSG
jgi:hypothetical protein